MNWEAIVNRGVESDELDYKSAQNWNKLSKTGRAKFARHCMALANTKGGYVVVGVSEDASGCPIVRTGLTEEEAQSFDPTAVGNFVNRYADPQVSFTVERPLVDGKQYVIFVVKRFEYLPHVCTCGSEHELQQGVFYIRTADASSRPAYRASEVLALIQRAMHNERELLGRMIRGLLTENHLADPTEESRSRYDEELRHSRSFFERYAAPDSKEIIIDWFTAPTEYHDDLFSLTALRTAAEFAVTAVPESAFSTDFPSVYATNVSIRGTGKNYIWQLYRSGLFHYRMKLPAQEEFPFDILCAQMIHLTRFTAGLYQSLQPPNDEIYMNLSLNQVEGMRLSGFDKSVCRIPEIRIQRRYTRNTEVASVVEYSADVIRAICERFNLSGSVLTDLEQRLRKTLPA